MISIWKFLALINIDQLFENNFFLKGLHLKKCHCFLQFLYLPSVTVCNVVWGEEREEMEVGEDMVTNSGTKTVQYINGVQHSTYERLNTKLLINQ